eukprot:GSChrysophyteH2.ASY1.ANO1.1005.1 assembled CDS
MISTMISPRAGAAQSQSSSYFSGSSGNGGGSSNSSEGKQLRIADARPKLNANANALAGKGFENVVYLNGEATLTFLDVENIHVMRSSLLRLKQGLPKKMDTEIMSSSSWKVHLSLLLKGSIGLCEALILGHPVVVHCSDGWDRTSQLSSLTQVLLDPYYRTIPGFLMLVQKEWCAFGHKFEDRMRVGVNPHACTNTC